MVEVVSMLRLFMIVPLPRQNWLANLEDQIKKRARLEWGWTSICDAKITTHRWSLWVNRDRVETTAGPALVR
jgi:hypothetical protein